MWGFLGSDDTLSLFLKTKDFRNDSELRIPVMSLFERPALWLSAVNGAFSLRCLSLGAALWTCHSGQRGREAPLFVEQF